MSDEVEKAKAAAGGEKVERTLFEKIIAREVSFVFFVRDHPFKTSACLRGEGCPPWADGQKVTVHKDRKSRS